MLLVRQRCQTSGDHMILLYSYGLAAVSAVVSRVYRHCCVLSQ